MRWAFAYMAGNYDWSYFPWFPWLTYPLLGFAAHQGLCGATVSAAPRRRDACTTGVMAGCWRIVAVAVAIACAVGTAMTWEFAVAVCHDLPRYYHHDLRFFLWVCAFLVVWIGVHCLCERHFGRTAPVRWLKDLGRHVTLCYVIQWLLIGNIATELYRSETLLHWGLWVLVILTATTLLARLFIFARRELSPLWDAVVPKSEW